MTTFKIEGIKIEEILEMIFWTEFAKILSPDCELLIGRV